MSPLLLLLQSFQVCSSFKENKCIHTPWPRLAWRQHRPSAGRRSSVAATPWPALPPQPLPLPPASLHALDDGSEGQDGKKDTV